MLKGNLPRMMLSFSMLYKIISCVSKYNECLDSTIYKQTSFKCMFNLEMVIMMSFSLSLSYIANYVPCGLVIISKKMFNIKYLTILFTVCENDLLPLPLGLEECSTENCRGTCSRGTNPDGYVFDICCAGQ